jgi:hypothetical protein
MEERSPSFDYRFVVPPVHYDHLKLQQKYKKLHKYLETIAYKLILLTKIPSLATFMFKMEQQNNGLEIMNTSYDRKACSCYRISDYSPDNIVCICKDVINETMAEKLMHVS